MARGLISQRTLCAIANAIRMKSGNDGRLAPGEMAEAVLALDGSGSDGAQYEAPGKGKGYVDDGVFDDIAAAIRTKNGKSVRYKPREMAPAILALEFVVELKPRALLLEDGTLEFTYLESVESPSGGAVARIFDVPMTALGSAAEQPWIGAAPWISKVVFDPSFGEVAISDLSFWFSGFSSLMEVWGFENLPHITTVNEVFTGCGKLESIFAAAGFAPAITAGTLPFGSCYRLVGGRGFCPSDSATYKAFCHGMSGVFTDPAADNRRPVWARLYDDGELVINVQEAADEGRECVAAGRLYVSAYYESDLAQPYADRRDSVLRVSIEQDVSKYTSGINLEYWFYGCTKLTEVEGLSNFQGLFYLNSMFEQCESLVELDMRGVQPPIIKDVSRMFAGCKALTTILADSSWRLPSDAKGSRTFDGCVAIRGGAGTTYLSSRIEGLYMRIDKSGAPGYLTAG